MTNFEAFLFLFTDSILAKLAFMRNTQMVFPAMKFLGNYNLYLASIISSVASIIAALLNYLLGVSARHIKQYNGPDTEKFISLTEFVRKKLYWLPILIMLPIFGILSTLLAGFFRQDIGKLILYTALGAFIYHFALILI
jgi:membrane protein YqaA with SNARE-associated domain